MIHVLIIVVVLACLALVYFYRHQRLLKERAQIMRDAIRHRDFSFRLPTRGLLFGEKALQEALNDLGSETQKLLARGEVESWQKLTRILTHEIMNAATPIQSISQAYLSSPDIDGSPFKEGIRAIHDTSTGMTAFIDNYRKLTQLQEPVITDINVLSFAESLASLYPQLQWHIDIPADLHIRADENLLRQVFINLVKNAIEAEAKTISLSPTLSRGRGSFRGSPPLSHGRGVGGEAVFFSNDGHAIPPSVAQEIFVPFFSTKQRGTGIGLSLSRQILMMMGMTLRLADNPRDGYNVTFVIEMN
ncbi:MAG: HAMP domain-containing histidine kinase [Bacteroidaceae bacterium]|nr:HAMP domain-containing histidine kinase [Bacteroidaceae bacterium]